MAEDKELEAMAAVNTALGGLEADAVARVLRWAADRYSVTLAARSKPGSGAGGVSPSEDTEELQGDKPYEHFSDLFDAADPTSDAERVLVAAYWFQAIKEQEELASQALNKELKNTGHGVTHMPHALDELMKAKPRLLIQIKKQGTTQQARRKFKVTTEGLKKVRGMLKGEGD